MRIFRNRQNICKRKQFENKAQTSFFLIVGLVLLIASIAGLFIYNKIKTSIVKTEAEKAALTLQAEEVEKFVNDCIRKTTAEGLQKLGQTGGYLDVPKLINFRGMSYWHLDQVNIQPFLNQTQQRLIKYINSKVPACVDEGKITELGFAVDRGQHSTFMEFGSSDVSVKVIYPIKLSKEDFTKEFSEFFNTFDIRYRAVFEAATETNEKTFEADFDVKNPLKKLDYLRNLDFDISYKNPETDIMVFTVTDKKSITSENQNYAFNFAAKLGRSELKRLTDLQNRSSTNPTFLPYTIFSVDKKAQLDISAGTTIVLNGQDVPSIIVQQSYPPSVITKNVPVEKENKEIKRREDLTYVLDNSVYSFEPSGLLFNKIQKLTLYYDDPQGKDARGVGILQGKNGFWVPIPSFEDRANRNVFAFILGFTDFTPVFCESQRLKKVVARQVFEPSGTCFVSLGLLIVSVILFSIIFSGLWTTLFTQGITEAIGFITTTLAEKGLLAYTALGLSALSLTFGIVGTATEAFYEESPENCQTFVPTCTWQVGVDTVAIDGEGKCIPEGGTMNAGVPVTLCAQVEKCNFIEKFTCQKCSVECTAQFY